jgi:hypothetical protein
MMVGAVPLMAARNSGTVDTVTVLLPCWSPPVVGPTGLSFAKPTRSNSLPGGAADAVRANVKKERIDNFILKVAGERQEPSTSNHGAITIIYLWTTSPREAVPMLKFRSLPQVIACILPVLQRMTEAVALRDVCRCRVYYPRKMY